jgi:hypothetical protein
MSGIGDTYECGICHGTFTKVRADDDAMAEAEAIYSPAELAASEIVCDDCWGPYMAALPRLRAEIDQEAAAAGLSYDEFVRREALR